MIFEFGEGYLRYLRYFDCLQPVETYLKGTIFEDNQWWYNIFWVFGGGLFVCGYVYKILVSSVLKNTVAVLSSAYVIFFIIRFYTAKNVVLNSNDMVCFMVGGFVIIGGISLYFIEVLRGEWLVSLKNAFNLLVLGALFVWWLTVAPTLFYEDYFNVTDRAFILLRRSIILSCNIVMYGVFSWALIYCKPQNN